MRKIAFACMIALAPLTACKTLGTPSTVADKTTLDEKAGIAAEALYQASVVVGHNLVTAGKITDASRKDLDNKAYTALLATRAAYNAGNATDYAAAAGQVTVATAAIFALVK